MKDHLAQFDKSWTHRVFANGLRVIHVPRSADERLYLSAIFRAGVRFDPPQLAGLSHFLEHSMFRGSQRYPTSGALSEAFEWLGGEWNAATSAEHTEYWYSGIVRNATAAIDLFAEFLTHSLLSSVDIERQIILKELQGDLNEFGISTDPTFHLAEAMWPGTTFAMPILGTAESLARITREDLVAHRDRFYTPKNMVICAVGGVDSELMFKELESKFGHHHGSSPSEPAQATPLPLFVGPQCVRRDNPDNEYQLQIGFALGGQWSALAPQYELISRILSDGFSSRLANRLREELGLVYDISSDCSLYTDVGSLNISAAVDSESFDDFLKELMTILASLAHAGPSENELARCVQRSLVDLELIPSEPASVGFRAAWNLLNGRDFSLARHREKLQLIRPSDLQKTCQEIFRGKNTAIIALGPKNASLETRMREAIAKYLPP